MEWLAIFTWGLITVVSLPLIRHAITTPGAAMASFAAVDGLALCVLFIALRGSRGLAWGAFGMAVVGIVATSLMGAWLASDDRSVSDAGLDSEVRQAGIAGFILPLFAVVTLMSLAMALDVATVA